jgi:hypothetical protein
MKSRRSFQIAMFVGSYIGAIDDDGLPDKAV